jgi:hypothetical protein
MEWESGTRVEGGIVCGELALRPNAGRSSKAAESASGADEARSGGNSVHLRGQRV